MKNKKTSSGGQAKRRDNATTSTANYNAIADNRNPQQCPKIYHGQQCTGQLCIVSDGEKITSLCCDKCNAIAGIIKKNGRRFYL